MFKYHIISCIMCFLCVIYSSNIGIKKAICSIIDIIMSFPI